MRAHNRLDITGSTFGRLTVVGYSHTNHQRKSVWRCICSCGNETMATAVRMRSGHTTSCGCRQAEAAIELVEAGYAKNFKHGMVNSPAYKSWDAAKQRCFNQNADNYHLYGGRGITMCDRWRSSFKNFLADMGSRPPSTTIDRIDNDGNYEPGNCRWATPKEQANNRSPRYYCMAFGLAITLEDAVASFGNVSLSTARERVKRGWDADIAILTPFGQKQVIVDASVPF